MLIILGLLLFAYLVEQTPWRQTKKAAWLIFLAAVFVMGWRSVYYTLDNVAYAQFFNLNSHYTLTQSWQKVLDGGGKDPFYFFVGNCFSKMGFTYRGWFVFIAVVYMGGFCYLMYKRSSDFFLSFFFLVTFGYFFFAMTGLRQALALGCCYFGFEFLCQKKPWYFALCVIAGSLFHSSALVFLLMYPITFIPFGWKYIPGVLAAPVIAKLFPGFLGTLVGWIAWNDDLEAYSTATLGLTISGYVIESGLLSFCIWCCERYKIYQKAGLEQVEQCELPQKADPYILSSLLNAVAVGTILRAFSININNFFRIAMYFSCLTPIVIPLVLEQMPSRERRFAMGAIMAVFFLHSFLRSGHWTYFSMFGELQ